jgi:hypothetical protein
VVGLSCHGTFGRARTREGEQAPRADLAGGLRPEDSTSAYYHTTAGQDVFLGSLRVVAVILLTYMSGQAKSADFIVSSIAGIALLGVVFFPTDRGVDLRQADPRLYDAATGARIGAPAQLPKENDQVTVPPQIDSDGRLILARGCPGRG